MSILAGLFSRGPKVRVHILIKGRIGDVWRDVDRVLELPEGTTLGQLITIAEKKGIPMRDAIDRSPHLRHTLMLNGERCPIDDNEARVLVDDDQLYLLAPFAGG